MYEKISDISQRIAKIEKLKIKICNEIIGLRERNYARLSYLLEQRTNNPNRYYQNKDFAETWESTIQEEYILLQLKEFLSQDSVFQSYEAKFPDKDIVIYQVSDELLNIWLQDDYQFALSFLMKFGPYGEGEKDVFPLLNDRYFGYEFTSIFDQIAYKEKEEDKER